MDVSFSLSENNFSKIINNQVVRGGSLCRPLYHSISVNFIIPADGVPETIVVLDWDLFGLKKAKVEQTGKW